MFLLVDETYTTAESYVFVQEDGERSIIMASGATSMISGETAIKNFGELSSFSLFVFLFFAFVPFISLFVYVEILQLRAKFQTAMVCLRFIWITNFSDHRRV